MNPDTIALNTLLGRLTHSTAQIREDTRQEIRNWPFETVLELLAQHWPEGYDLPRPEPATWGERLRRRWSPPEQPPLVSAVLDIIVIVHGEETTNPQMLGPILSVLARMEQRERELRAGSSNHWPNSVVCPMIEVSFGDDSPRPPLTRPAQDRLLVTLRRLLPLVTPANCELTPRQCDALLIPLKYPYRHVDLTLHILVLLSWLGAQRHLPLLERIEQGALGTDNGRRIRAAVHACLEQIRARNDKKQQAQSLLRPADFDSLFPPETLLRPITADAATPPDELLRARMKEEG